MSVISQAVRRGEGGVGTLCRVGRGHCWRCPRPKPPLPLPTHLEQSPGDSGRVGGRHPTGRAGQGRGRRGRGERGASGRPRRGPARTRSEGCSGSRRKRSHPPPTSHVSENNRAKRLPWRGKLGPHCCLHRELPPASSPGLRPASRCVLILGHFSDHSLGRPRPAHSWNPREPSVCPCWDARPLWLGTEATSLQNGVPGRC